MHKIYLSFLALSLSLHASAQNANKDSIASYCKQGSIFYQKKDYDNAAKSWEKALPLVEKYGKDYEHLLNALASVYMDTNDIPNQERIMALAEDHNRHELPKECNEPQCMLERAQYYSVTGNTVKAKETFNALLAMKMDNKTKADAYEQYAKFLTANKDWLAAADYQQQAALTTQKLIKNKKDIKNGTQYAQRTYFAALYYQWGGQHQKAVELQKTALAYFLAHPSETASKRIPDCYREIGHAYSGLKDYPHAIEYYQKLIDFYEQHDKNGSDYPKAILRLAKAEKFNKDYDLSITHHQQAMEMFEQRGMAEEYGDAANSLKLCYIYAGRKVDVDTQNEMVAKARKLKLERIIKEETQNLDMTRAYLGELAYAQSLHTIAGSYSLMNDYPHAVSYYKMYIPAIRKAIQEEFRMQDERDRRVTWQQEYEHIEEMKELLTLIPEEEAMTAEEKKNLLNEMTALAYDAELLSKGILLNSSIEFEKVLREKGDPELIKTYQQTQANEKEIQSLKAHLQTDADLERILQLNQQNQKLNLQLYKGCAEFADFTNYISYSWQDVQQKLRPSDVAIEFATIHAGVLDEDRHLVALVLTADMKTPALVNICNQKEAKEMADNDAIYDSDPCEIWQKLNKYLEGKQRIFFSADGYFNRIALEYLPYHGKGISEQMEVYRLSTTKELCYSRKQPLAKQAFLFGDIDYNGEASMNDNTKRALDKVRGADAALFSNLVSTRKEIDGIKKILKKGKVENVHLLSDTEASKKAFLSLSDSKVNLLHIATHGVYQEQKGMSDTESMDNCVLAFAGANIDSTGIVTAAEVAKMNLRDCDLVVLSACETALGKLGADGVFGLQRGFKNAGVHTILMSLKNVYDATTAELMVSFYKNLTQGMTKREALKKAQDHLKSKGYKEPKYWAPFILLDALQ